MKIALVTDTHFGARSDSQPFDAFFKKFYSEIFFPELDKQAKAARQRYPMSEVSTGLNHD